MRYSNIYKILYRATLSGNNMLSVPKVNTTKYGLNYFKYFAVKQWNSIPNELHLKVGGLEVNKQVRNIEF